MDLKSKLQLLILLALLWGCSSPRDPVSFTATPYMDAPAEATAYYDRDLQRVFDRSCTGGCHELGGTGDLQSGLLLSQALSYDELLDATASKNGPQVIPGDPANSLIIWKLEGKDSSGRDVFGDQMPLGRLPLSHEEIQAIKTWISEGAVRSLAPPVPPSVLEASSLDSITVDIIFSEELDRRSAESAGNYSITGLEDLEVRRALLEAPDRVRITTSPQTPGITYAVVVLGVRDQTGDEIVAGEGNQAAFQFTPEVSFSAQIIPIIQANCAFLACHTASTQFPPGEGLVLDSGVVRGNLVDVNSRQQATLKLVLPEDPDASYLIQKMEGGVSISGERMPQGGPYLLPANMQLFRLWIDQGAKDN